MDRRSSHALHPAKSSPRPDAERAGAPKARQRAGGERKGGARGWLWGWALALALCALCWWGVSWGKGEVARRVRAAITTQAQKIGWSVEVERVEVDWGGQVTVTGLRAVAATGGEVYIQTLRGVVPPSQWLDGPRRPALLWLQGVRAEVSVDEVRSARQRLKERQAGAGDEGQRALPTIHVLDLDARLTGPLGGAEGAQVTAPRRLIARSVVLRRGDEGWSVALDGELVRDDVVGGEGARLALRGFGVLGAQEVNAGVHFPQQPLVIGVGDAGTCSARGVQVSAAWEGALRVEALRSARVEWEGARCALERLGEASLRALTMKREPAQGQALWALQAQGLLISPDARFGFERLSVALVSAHVVLGAGEHAGAGAQALEGARLDGPITFTQPDIKLDLRAVVGGPVAGASPQAAKAMAQVMERLGWEAPTLRPLPAPRAKPKAGEVAAQADRLGQEAGAALGGLDKLLGYLDRLPPLRVEDGRVTVGVVERASEHQEGGPREWRLSGLDFGASQGQEAGQRAGQRLEVGFRVQGAAAKLSLDLPREAGMWPKAHLTLQGVALPDLFQVAGLTAPAQLGGVADLDLSFYRDDVSKDLILEGSAGLKKGAFHHPKVSEQPLRGIALGARGRLRYRPLSDGLWLEDAEVSSGPLRLNIAADIQHLQDDPTLTFRLWQAQVPCDAIAGAIPKGALESIERVVMRGRSMSPDIEGSLRVQDPMSFSLKVEGIPGDCGVAALPPYDVARLNDPSYVHTTTYTSFPEGIEVGPGKGPKMFTPLAALPSYLPAAMFMTEDIRFFDHGGVRLEQFVRAVRLNLTEGRYVYGGSSLTQQLIKNLLLHRRKTLSRKLEEALLAWHIEDIVSKERILELYINCIEFGPDIYGVTQAAAFYFDKKPAALTPLEAAFLASLKVAPRYGGSFYEGGFPNEKKWWSKRPKEIVLTLARNGYISPAEVLASYPFLPTFIYPDESDTKDFRNQWLARRRQGRKSARNP
jgi:hypothetical protein